MSTLALDIETQFFGDERPKRGNQVAVAGFMHLDRGEVYEFGTEARVERLFDRLDAVSLIVGHNLLRFDYAVLDRYLPGVDARRRCEDRMLDMLADATLVRRKPFVIGGVPKLWRPGKLLELLERNRAEVELSRDLCVHGREFGWVGARDPETSGLEQLAVDWT